MQTFSTNPFQFFRSSAGKVTALATIIGLLVLSFASYTQSQPNYPKTLSGFYAQKLDWQSCYGNYQCSDLLVPIDYTNLKTGTFHISVLKYSTTTKKKLGSLIVNPGGPGASGVDYAYSAEYLFSPEILDHYDIVGFDPRGVSRSEPIICLSDKELDVNYSSDSKPDNAKEFKDALVETKKFVAECKRKNKHLSDYSTANAARDMDILRQAVGDKQLNYMGKSYGTFLGTLYAQFFPDKVGRMVLDGAVDPTISNYQQSLTQAVGFDHAFDSFAAYCEKKSNCPLPKDKSAAVEAMQTIFTNAAKNPLPTKMKSKRVATESLIVLGTASAMYDSKSGWPQLRKAITEAKKGYGDTFLKLADQYTGRLPHGSYGNNEFDSGAIIDCLDFTDPRSVAQIKSDAQSFAQQAQLFGPYLAYSGLTCKYFDQTKATKIVPTKTANPIVIIGTTGDPATPYAWAQGLHKILTTSVLISFSGEGHTGQGQGNACVDNQIDDFYLTNRIPKTPSCS
jgi:pimeloyl-ACP methyl ester carboxylesterase